MLMKFIGRDGSMGLKKDQVYQTKVMTRNGHIVVSWVVLSGRGTRVCPYDSPQALAKNWEGVKK